MKAKLLLFTFGLLSFSGCDKTKDPAIDSLRAISVEENQPEYIRASVKLFEDFFDGKAVTHSDFEHAKAELCATRNDVTLSSLIAILNASAKRLPEVLPSEEEARAFYKKVGKLKSEEVIYQYNPLSVLIFVRYIIPIITYFDDKKGDFEVERFILQFETKYGSSPSGKYWLSGFRMKWNEALETRKGHNGKAYSGRKQLGLESE
jgi:hypothetical protein